jgi:hypothetical protein
MQGATQDQPNFKTQFRLLRANVIRPVLEEFKGRLETEGYRAEVTTADGSLDPDGERPDRITMGLPHADLLTPPSVEFFGFQHDGRVRVAFTIATRNESRGSVRGTYRLNEITSEVVEAIAVRFLKELGPHFPAPET